MKIGELARVTQTVVETIRFYEREGLLPMPARTAGNYRIYEPAHVDRLRFIRRTRDLGFSPEQVRRFLALADRGTSDAQADTHAAAAMVQIDRKLADLKAMKRELARLDIDGSPASDRGAGLLALFGD